MEIEKNYRKIYENKTGLKIPSNWHIHHIDGNKKNNRLNNLVALPKSLHCKYHSHINSIQEIKKYKLNLSMNYKVHYNSLNESIESVSNILEIIYISQNYIDLRDFLINLNKYRKNKTKVNIRKLYYYFNYSYQMIIIFENNYLKKINKKLKFIDHYNFIDSTKECINDLISKLSFVY